MAWKTIDGRRYHYKSERDGGRVKTTYFGAGESGLLISQMEAIDRKEKDVIRNQRRAEREEYLAEEKVVKEWFDARSWKFRRFTLRQSRPTSL